MPLQAVAARRMMAPGAEDDSAAQGAGALPRWFDALHAALGPQHWWPARTPSEVIVGAILTQSTAWVNVERAIANLRAARMLSPRALRDIPTARLARLVKPSGYFRQKARKLKAFVRFLYERYAGSLARMFATPTAKLREELLAVHGVGPETADSILLYAGGKPVFVVDAYTKRILVRHALAGEKAGYEEIRALFEGNLPRDTQLYNEFHALLVQIGKHWCRPREAKCDECALRSFLLPGQPKGMETRVQVQKWKSGNVEVLKQGREKRSRP